MAALGAGTTRRTILFLDHQGWSAFDQVACAVRRDGIRAIKITDARRKAASMRDLRWWADRFFYDERLAFDDPRDLARIEKLLAGGEIADVVVAEPSLAAIGFRSTLGQKLTAHSLAFAGTPAEILLDKFEVNHRLATIGIGVPRQVPVAGRTPAEIAGEFGLPSVVKAPTGAAGQSVRIAESEAAIASALEELGGESEDLFYQEHIAGERVSYNAVVGEDGPRMEHGFISCEAQYPMGPSAFVRRHDDPDLLKAGRAAARLFGCRGFVSFGFIQAPDGRLYHLDPNIRPWGSLLAPLVEGIDFAAAYTALVNERPLPAQDLAVLPGVLVHAKTVPTFLAALTMLWRVHGRRLALSYAALMSARATLVGFGRLGRRTSRLLRHAEPVPALKSGKADFIEPGGKSVA